MRWLQLLPFYHVLRNALAAMQKSPELSTSMLTENPQSVAVQTLPRLVVMDADRNFLSDKAK